MPFRFIVWISKPEDTQLGKLGTEVLVESRLIAVVQFGRSLI